jgi:GT2 family glycosyltransferase
VTACLLSWKRPLNLQVIVDHLHSLPMVDEILVWNNNPEVGLRLTGPRVRVIQSGENVGCQARFLCAQQARNQVIYSQDDDVLVMNVPQMYRAFLLDPSRVTHALSDWHYARREDHVHPDGHVALLGWGSFFLKSWVEDLDRLPARVRRSDLFAREADKYFTVWLHHRHQTIRGRLRELPGHSDPASALWLQPHHTELSALATREALRLSRERHRPHIPVRWHIVITCRDYGRYLEECVRSAVINEADCQVTIVDDGSTDDSQEVARDLAQRYGGVATLQLRRPLGPGGAANRGIASRDSVFVVRLDADDLLGPRYLREADAVLAAGADVANPDAILFDQEVSRWPVPPLVQLPTLLVNNRVHCASAFRRGLWAQVGGFDEGMDAWEDYEFWIRLAAAGARIRCVPGDHFFYRRHAGSRSETAGDTRHLQRYLRTKHQTLYSALGA